MRRRFLSLAIYGLSGLIGLAAFAYPFFLPIIRVETSAEVGPVNAPLLTMVLVVLCLVVLLVEVQGQAVSAKVAAALGLLVAVTSVLRFVETAVPGPAGFSPIFVPILLAGYVFGARFGFLMGALTLLTSALITGGVGPWLPYQMFTAGWVGLTAGWLPHPQRPAAVLTLLILFGFAWGMAYGLVMNLYFWPFIMGDPAMSWRPGAGLWDGVSRYAAFYLATSIYWDFARAIGNALLLLALGLPVIRALARFRDRFQFAITPPEVLPALVAHPKNLLEVGLRD
jgi:energy-coupling factor transport system substrate-specific component